MSDIEPRSSLSSDESPITETLSKISRIGAELICLRDVTVIVRISVSCHFAALFDKVLRSAGSVEFVHAFLVSLLGDGFDAVSVVVGEDDLCFNPGRWLSVIVVSRLVLPGEVLTCPEHRCSH
jgi:hypothetical protein